MSGLSDLHISVNQHGNPVDPNAKTPVVNYSTLNYRTFVEGLTRPVEQSPLEQPVERLPLHHRSLARDIIYSISDGTRSNHGVIEHLTWVSEDGKIGEKVSDKHLKKMCHSYASRTMPFNYSGGKRKTRKTRRSRK